VEEGFEKGGIRSLMQVHIHFWQGKIIRNTRRVVKGGKNSERGKGLPQFKLRKKEGYECLLAVNPSPNQTEKEKKDEKNKEPVKGNTCVSENGPKIANTAVKSKMREKEKIKLRSDHSQQGDKGEKIKRKKYLIVGLQNPGVAKRKNKRPSNGAGGRTSSHDERSEVL